VLGTLYRRSENPLGPLLPKREKITEEIEMWQKSSKSFTKMNEGGDEKD
jgi:hypothetical protein